MSSAHKKREEQEMKRKRRNHSPSFKAKVALVALREGRTKNLGRYGYCHITQANVHLNLTQKDILGMMN